MAEHQPSKLRVAGSTPVSRSTARLEARDGDVWPLAGVPAWMLKCWSADAHVAQSVERVLGKDEVSGSIPLVGSSSTEAQ